MRRTAVGALDNGSGTHCWRIIKQSQRFITNPMFPHHRLLCFHPLGLY